MNKKEIQEQAYRNAVNGESLSNYPLIFDGFKAKGIDPDDIKPRENVFTYHAWRELGRQVSRGEHGVRICTWILVGETEDTQTGEKKPGYRKPHYTTVFHVSQTTLMNGQVQP